jgi:TonB family protein
MSFVLVDSTQLEVIKAPEPDYPLEAAAKKVQGKVVIELNISETGDFDHTNIVSGEPILAAAAESAMKTWKFKPFIRDGKLVQASIQVPWEFARKGHTSNACALVQAFQAMNLAHHREGSDRIRTIDSKVMDGAIIQRIEPQYPLKARKAYIQGTVILAATIDKDGLIHNLKPLCGPTILSDASMDAIKQWRYRPFMVEGQPVEAETTIKVEFHMP